MDLIEDPKRHEIIMPIYMLAMTVAVCSCLLQITMYNKPHYSKLSSVIFYTVYYNLFLPSFEVIFDP
jgi:hypothetical protein